MVSLYLLLIKLEDKDITLETPGKLSTGVSKLGAAILAHWAFLYDAQFPLWRLLLNTLGLFFLVMGEQCSAFDLCDSGKWVIGKNPIQQLPLLTSVPAG